MSPPPEKALWQQQKWTLSVIGTVASLALFFGASSYATSITVIRAAGHPTVVQALDPAVAQGILNLAQWGFLAISALAGAAVIGNTVIGREHAKAQQATSLMQSADTSTATAQITAP